MLEKLLQWDRDTFVYLNNLGLEEYDYFWSIVTNISTWIPLYLLFFILFFIKRPKKEAIVMSATVLLMFLFVLLFTDLTKNIVERLRPSNDEAINDLIRILKTPTDFSFFSGHASSSFAITTIVVLLLKNKMKWVWVFYIWPLLFCLSRIYVGVHFPIDLLVGALVGVLCALLFYYLYNKLIKPYLL
ncbi:phosphatase PAP2 family protein [Cellulophaga sp. F20128]|uniref:phosphatase PAP2 family protein n=1 Tax=Cellulophaga sp. F20128 TaxID=2926413 RepID=UPI001FF5EFBD|nr:phosphatase PAP2 family protein [Cellulophaga sp. F20128]MCK0158464.1 phosphatase PAP2 family protein [Cellulophaga sp. F20128]